MFLHSACLGDSVGKCQQAPTAVCRSSARLPGKSSIAIQQWFTACTCSNSACGGLFIGVVYCAVVYFTCPHSIPQWHVAFVVRANALRCFALQIGPCSGNAVRAVRFVAGFAAWRHAAVLGLGSRQKQSAHSSAPMLSLSFRLRQVVSYKTARTQHISGLQILDNHMVNALACSHVVDCLPCLQVNFVSAFVTGLIAGAICLRVLP